MPWKESGVWRTWVRDAVGVQHKVQMPEAKNREEAKRLEQDLRMKSRRQREGLEPLATDCTWTVRQLLRWWLDTYIKGLPSERQEEGRFRINVEGSDFANLRLVGLTGAHLEVFLQHWTQNGLAPASVNKLRAMVR